MIYSTIRLYKKLNPSLKELFGMFLYLLKKRTQNIAKHRKYQALQFFLNKRKKIQYYPEKQELKVELKINDIETCLYIRKKGSDIPAFNQVILHDEYFNTIHLLRGYKEKVNNIIDLGCNIGLASIYFKRYFPNSKIISLEPEVNNYKLAQKNIETNNIKDIYIINKGIWTHETQLYPDKNFRDKLAWSFTLTERRVEGENPISVISLESIMKEFKIDSIDILKIDIEGGELKLLYDQNFLNNLKNNVKLLLIEIHEEVISFKKASKIIEDASFLIIKNSETTIGINRKFLKTFL